MDQEKKSLFQRIRNARQSLENAEKSFQDDRGMRGELDLMLAEAELKNLRNKQSLPWSWNRHILAFSVAMLLVVSGVVGWYFAKEDMQKAEVVPSNVKNLQTSETATIVGSIPQKSVKNENTIVNSQKIKQNLSENTQETAPTVQLSEADKRRLVRSAKSELSN